MKLNEEELINNLNLPEEEIKRLKALGEKIKELELNKKGIDKSLDGLIDYLLKGCHLIIDFIIIMGLIYYLHSVQ